MKQDYLVLKYYHYTPIDDVVQFRCEHHLYAIEQGLRGRIKIAKEGINGTISGTVAACDNYMNKLRADSRFAGIEFNVTPATEHVHDKLHVRLKREIVHSGLSKEIMPSRLEAERYYIDAATFQKMRKEQDVVLIDVRSTVEHRLGKFEQAVTFDIPNYRSFFTEADKRTFDKDKRYIVICTRGIKSEKARDYLRMKHGLKHVYHLKGGILDYAKNSDGSGFEGVCYVFDKRLIVAINQKNPTIISHCYLCENECIRMVNCANPTCNAHVPLCDACGEQNGGACSEACREHPEKRPYNGVGYYAKKTNHYDPHCCATRKISAEEISRL